jgi:hypothetical protein
LFSSFLLFFSYVRTRTRARAHTHIFFFFTTHLYLLF